MATVIRDGWRVRARLVAAALAEPDAGSTSGRRQVSAPGEAHVCDGAARAAAEESEMAEGKVLAPVVRRAALCVAICAGAALGCATPEVIHWSRNGGKERQFQRDSRVCGDRAVAEIANSRGEVCIYNEEIGGTVCGRVDPNNEQEQRRRKRRLRYLYGECLESRGWFSNYEGQGFRGLY
jgi:hypothetical protein